MTLPRFFDYNKRKSTAEGTATLSVEWILELVLFSILHWILAGIVLNDIASRKHVLGGHKAPWVVTVILLTFLGSLLYLLCHPQILGGDDEEK
jgi:hypothetical protein